MHRGEASDWRALAKCATLSAEETDAIFFPPPGGKSKRAELFCQGCPVMRECLNTSLAPGTTGFWAGTTERDRRGMREFVSSVPRPLAISECMPKEPTRKARRLKPVPNSTSIPSVGIDYIEGPSLVEELRMLG